MLLRLLAGIWGLVLIILGVVFTVLGAAVDAGDRTATLILGLALLAAGLACAAVFALLQRREAVRRGRRQRGPGAKAEIVAARLHPYTRIGVMLTYTVTVRFAPATGGGMREATRRLLVPPNLPLAPGARVQVAYDPEDPANFEPVGPAGP